MLLAFGTYLCLLKISQKKIAYDKDVETKNIYSKKNLFGIKYAS